jgi:hypothetical protein
MIPLLINQSNISRDFSLQLSKCLADSDLVVIGLTGIGPMWKISVLDWLGDKSLMKKKKGRRDQSFTKEKKEER